jgi:hypothetical protein
MPTRLSRFSVHERIAWRALRALRGIKGPTVSSDTALWDRPAAPDHPARLGEGAMTTVIAAIARGDRPIVLASLIAGSGLLLALLCAAGAP